MAWNSGDFTIRQLTDNYKYLNLDGLVQQYEDQGDDPWVFRGPLPFEPVKVQQGSNGSFEVTVCALPFRDWTIAKSGDRWPSEPSGAYLQTWEIDDYHHDGRYILTAGGSVSRMPCDGTTIPVGFLETQPVLPKGPVTQPKRTPLPEPKRTPYPVTACVLPLPDWTISDRSIRWSSGPSGPTLRSWTVKDYYHDGRLLLDGGAESSTPCDGSTVPVGLFDPQPAVPKIPVTHAKRTPLPEPKRTPFLGNH